MNLDLNPLVSVIIPIYNVELYLSDCLDSVIGQSYSNLEIILVNDGSPDRSAEICEEYAKKDMRVKIINKRNGGLSDARNAGLDKSTGDYICFIDSDDLVHVDFLQVLVSSIGKADICMCYFKKFTGNDIPINLSTGNIIVEEYSGSYVNKNLYEKRFGLNATIAWNKLYKRSLWENVRYPYGKLHEDEFIIHHILDQTNLFHVANASLYYYRERAGSITNGRRNLNNVIDTMEALSLRGKYYQEKGWPDQVKKTKSIERSLLLSKCVKNTFPEWKTYYLKEILKDNLTLKVKSMLILKKIFPIGYRVIARLKAWD